MNIFFLNDNPFDAAKMLHDVHVRSQIKESAQMLSTVYGLEYQPTHVNHPCVLWLRQHDANMAWLISHGMALGIEYQHRFNKIHASARVIISAVERYRETHNEHYHSYCKKHTPPALAMPDEFKCDDAVQAYIDYYIARKLDQRPKWTNRPIPEEFTPHVDYRLPSLRKLRTEHDRQQRRILKLGARIPIASNY